MKKALLLILGLLICATLFATDIEAVGNIRMGGFTVKYDDHKNSVFDFEIGNDIYFNGKDNGFCVGLKFDLMDFTMLYVAPVCKFEAEGFEVHIALGCIPGFMDAPLMELGSTYYFDGKNGVQLMVRFSLGGDYHCNQFCVGYSFKFK